MNSIKITSANIFFLVGILALFSPQTTLAYSVDFGEYGSIENGRQAPDGSHIGEYNSTGFMASHDGMQAMYSHTLDSWVVSDPMHNGSDGPYSMAGYYQQNNVRTRTFCEGDQSKVEITVGGWNLWDYNLWINGSGYGGISSKGVPKTVTLPGGQTYQGQIESWSLVPDWDFSFTTENCGPAPTCVLSDGGAISGWGGGSSLLWSGGYAEGSLLQPEDCGTLIIPGPDPLTVIPPLAYIQASPATVYINNSASSLTFGRASGGYADSCSVEGLSGSSPLPRSFSSVGSYTYRAYCDGPGGRTPEPLPTATITVIYPPPTLNLTAKPTVPAPIDTNKTKYKGTATLNWNSTWTTGNCDASSQPTGFWSGSKPRDSAGDLSGQLTANSTTFILSCLGLDGTRVTVPAGLGVEFGTGADIKVVCGTSSGSSVIVRKGTSCRVEWKTGTSEPQYCVLRAGSSPFLTPLTTTEGSTNYTVNGEVTLFVDCEDGNNMDSQDVKVLPEFQET